MLQQSRAFRIDRGIGQYNFTDYYAILGLPITADSLQIRKRYLAVAKKLHPDLFEGTDEDKLSAIQYFSKLVNPAYNLLTQERERTEYSALLRLLAKRLMRRSERIQPKGETALQLLHSSSSKAYEHLIKDLARVQYDSLPQALDHIAHLSELNLVYILLEEGYRPFGTEVHKIKSVATTPTEGDITVVQRGQASVAASGSSAAMGYASRFNSGAEFNGNSGDTTATNIPQNSGANSGTDISEQIATAEKYIAQKQWASALRELREAVKRDQKHSRAHALLGLTYMNQKLMGMAKVSFQQALKINPKEELALKYIAEINGETKSQNTSGKSGNGKTGGSQEGGDKNKKGGFFGWLGGG
jgi:curved DNA-binding protein CbpA